MARASTANVEREERFLLPLLEGEAE